MTTARRPKVMVLGSLNADLVARVARHPKPGETVLATGSSTGPGGKGANQAVAAARAGAPTSMVGATGDDAEGKLLRRTLLAAGADVRRVAVHPDVPTGRALVTVDGSGENSIVVIAGANAALSPEQAESAASELTRGDVLVLQLESPLDTVVRAAQHARERRATVLLNAAPAAQVPDELLAAVDLLVVNEHELRVVSGDKAGTHEQSAAALAARHGLVVVVTLGAAGALLVGPQRMMSRCPAPRVSPVDTTAAGDTFVGYLAAGLASGHSLDGSAGRAVAAASLAVTRPGAQTSIPTAAQVTHARSGAPESAAGG